MKHRPGQKDAGVVDIRFSYDMNGILEVEVHILHSGQKVSEVFEQRPGTLSKEDIRDAIQRMQPMKVHPRDTPHNRARLERANRLWSDMRGEERQELSMLIDAFERALATQDPVRIRESGELLDAFLQPWFPGDE